MSLSSWFLILLLVLPLPLIRCCCSFSFCHFSYLYLQFLYPYMSHFLFVNFPVIHPRCDKLTVVYLLFLKFNSSQMLEFDDSCKLMTTRILHILSSIVPYEEPFTSPFSFSCFTIIPDDSNTSILIPLTNPCMSLSFSNNWGSLSVLLLRSQMSPHVMYGST